MNFDLEETIQKLINHPYFQKSKTVLENNENHIDDPVFDHQMRTYEKAKEVVKGDLITNPEAKIEFEKLMDTKIDGIRKNDLLQITALLHDIGKVIKFDENHEEKLILRKLSNGKTNGAGHEYWGAVLAKQMLKEMDFPNDASDHIYDLIRLHNTGFNFWYEEISNHERLYEIKLKSENLHTELIIGTYCDLFYGNGFKAQLHLPIEVLNMPQAYRDLEIKII